VATPLSFVVAEQARRPRIEKRTVRFPIGLPAFVVSLAWSLGTVSTVGDCRPSAALTSRLVGVRKGAWAALTGVDSIAGVRRAAAIPVANATRPSRRPGLGVPVR